MCSTVYVGCICMYSMYMYVEYKEGLIGCYDLRWRESAQVCKAKGTGSAKAPDTLKKLRKMLVSLPKELAKVGRFGRGHIMQGLTG